MQVVLVTALAAVLTGCATSTGSLRTTIDQPTETVASETVASETVASETVASTVVASTVEPSTPDLAPADDSGTPVLLAAEYRLDGTDSPAASVLLAQSASAASAAADGPEEEYDPWEPFNERMFEFNRRLDRYVFKPVAQAYNTVVPDRVQVMIANGFDNIQFVPRMMNSFFQGKVDGGMREIGRFLLNSTVGIGGLFDVAKMEVEPTLGQKVPGIDKSREDFGQTLGFYGVGPGPFLILPFLEPLTVRDGIGKAVDGFMDPLAYFTPFFFTRLIMKVEETINDRSLNLELFQGFEESVIDFYSAVRHGYLKRREKLIKE
jgi:phospholipid-binding lipoprotein MlaA